MRTGAVTRLPMAFEAARYRKGYFPMMRTPCDCMPPGKDAGDGDSDGSAKTDAADVDASPRLVSNRRLVASVGAGVVYAAVLGVVVGRGGEAEATLTVHGVRYLILVSALYTFASGVNGLWGYKAGIRRHGDTLDFAGGVGVTAGTSVFYAEVIETEAAGASVVSLLLASLGISLGMLAILKIEVWDFDRG